MHTFEHAPAAAQSSLIETVTTNSCPSSLTGRTLEIEATSNGFGTSQGLPALPLGPNEFVLTIDDGPNSETTKQIVDLLAENCIKATFMLIGKKAEQNPDLVQYIANHGHTIGSHSYSHPSFDKMPFEQIRSEVIRGKNAVAKAASEYFYNKQGRSLFRIPSLYRGKLGPDNDLLALLQEQKLVLTGWDLDGWDWKNWDAKISFDRIFHANVKRGIILIHDGTMQSLNLLLMIIDEAKRRNATFVSLKI